jgi:mono/diheme cytochrome c family protein
MSNWRAENPGIPVSVIGGTMKMIRFVGKLLVVLIVFAGIAMAFVYWRSSSLMGQHIEVNEPALVIPTDGEALARGEHIAVTRGCADCHGADLGGRVLIDAFPIGRIAAPNLTQGKGGIGPLDATRMERAIRHGIGVGGRLLLYMPATDFSGLSDADTADLMAYVSTRPAVDREIPAPTAGPLVRTLFMLDQAPLVYALKVDHRAPHVATMTPSATAEYGRYVARACTGCHGEHFSGGHVPGTPPDFPDAANITPTGIGKWTKDQFFAALREGKRPDGRTLNPFMPWKAFSTMTDTELEALWAYLQKVPAAPTGGH